MPPAAAAGFLSAFQGGGGGGLPTNSSSARSDSGAEGRIDSANWTVATGSGRAGAGGMSESALYIGAGLVGLVVLMLAARGRG